MLAKRLALLTTTIVLLLVLAEIATRLLTDTIPPLTVKDPVIGQHYLPSFEADVFVPEAHRKVHLRFNEVGFRGPDRPMRKPPGVRRVAVLGDSMIASVTVDEKDTLVCQLERMLTRSHPQVKWEVLNFGVCGASPGQAMVLYRELAYRWDPDVVLCAYFVGNDLADNCSRLSHNPRIYFDLDEQGTMRQEPFSARRAWIGYYLNRYSRFYVWQKCALNNARRQIMEVTGTVEPGHWIFCRNESEDLAHAWKLTGEINRAFQREVTRRGASFALLLIPAAEQVDQHVFESLRQKAGDLADQFDWDYPDERLGELCRAADVSFLSMTADFRQAAPDATSHAKDQWLFCNGRGHFNERGNRLAAQRVHHFLTHGFLTHSILTRGGQDHLADRPSASRH
ncbi:MAG: hypothetical protein A2V70_19350 [Planctomycetes bacterium RBG_13_63_9]|nr:MAG: hypothetical protein A2V70_19350 [Planctomycetes bacterium RBG_13_63_9]